MLGVECDFKAILCKERLPIVSIHPQVPTLTLLGIKEIGVPAGYDLMERPD